MEDSYDLNLIRSDFIKNSERKTPNDCPSKISVNDWIQLGIANNSQQRLIDPLHELEVQTFTVMRIPLAGVGKFGIRVRREPDDHGG